MSELTIEELRELFDAAIDQRDGLREIIQDFASDVRWTARRTDTHVEVPLALMAKLDADLLAWATTPTPAADRADEQPQQGGGE